MQLSFLGMTSNIKNHRNSNMYNSQPGVGIGLQGPSQNRRKLPQNIVQFAICHFHNVWPWKWAHCPYVCSHYTKNGPLYFKRATQKFFLLKAI